MTALDPPRAVREPLVLSICPYATLAFLALTALFFISYLGSIAALLFLVAGLTPFLLAPRETVGALADAWWILLLPLWCVMSAFWSDDFGLSLRYGIQLLLTVAIGVTLANRLSPRTLLKVVFFAGLLAALASAGLGRERDDGLAFIGIYASKNDFAFAVAIFLCASAALALGRDSSLGLRLLALASLPFAFALILMANSMGWLATSLLMVVTGMSFAVMNVASVPLRLLLLLLFLLLLLVGAALANIYFDALVGLMVETTGKDVTLTGRTMLWQAAREEIDTAPVLGHGFQAFWLPGNPVAEAMWAEFGIASKSGFHFHNTWLSNAVEIGVVGVALQALVFGAALIGSIYRALLRTYSESLFFAMLLTALAAISVAEVVAFLQFHTASLLVVAAATFTQRARQEGVLRKV